MFEIRTLGCMMVGRRALAATQIVQICADENSSNTSSNHVWKCCPR